MTVLHLVSGGFIRLAGKWVDDALGTMVGYNFFFYEALMIPFEITAINLILSYWRDDIPVAAVCAVCIVLYAYDFLVDHSEVVLKPPPNPNFDPTFPNYRTKNLLVL